MTGRFVSAREITDRARRVAALAAFVATFDRAEDRIEVVRLLLAGGLIKPETSEILLEEVAI